MADDKTTSKHERQRKEGPSGPRDEEGKLRNAAGQAWDSERMDKINDDDVDHLQIDEMVLNESGERKNRPKARGGESSGNK